jgi:ABC-type transport system involved in multi-copper enzyme maturation permease subunit
MLGVFTWESYKLLKRPAAWVLLGILLLLAIGLFYVTFYFVYTYANAGPASGLPKGVKLSDFKIGLYPPAFVKYTISSLDTLGGVFALILGVLSQGSEYGWGTIKTLFTQRPGRVALLAGKLAALLAAVFVMVVALFAVCALSSVAIAAVDGKLGDFPPAIDIVRGVASLWLIYSFFAVFGFGLATIFQQSAMAIGLGLAYAILIEGIIFGIAANIGGEAVKRIESWFPIANVGYLSGSFGAAVPEGLQRSVAKPYADANHAVAALLMYIALFVVASALLVRRRDVL